jgi:hypothetical protein
MNSSLRFVTLGLLLSTAGCHVYHSAKFALQDRHPPLDEPYLLGAPPTDLAGATKIATGQLQPVHGGNAQFGEATVYRTETRTLIHVANWATVEGPDLYFYLGQASFEAVQADHDLILDSSTSVQLTLNNLRPSTLGFSGASTWFSAPLHLADAESLVIHCTAFSKLFAGTSLKPAE